MRYAASRSNINNRLYANVVIYYVAVVAISLVVPYALYFSLSFLRVIHASHYTYYASLSLAVGIVLSLVARLRNRVWIYAGIYMLMPPLLLSLRVTLDLVLMFVLGPLSTLPASIMSPIITIWIGIVAIRAADSG